MNEQRVLEKEEIEIKEEEKEKKEIEFPKIGEGKYIEGIGRRKTSTCRVRIYDGNKNKEFDITVNGKSYEEYFHNNIEFIKIVNAPLRKLRAFGIYKVNVKAYGGGMRGQAEAIRLGLSRALVKLNPEWKPIFKKVGYLTRDPRMVERKKYGKRKARKEEQWSKR